MRRQPTVQNLAVPLQAQPDRRAERWQACAGVPNLHEQDVTCRAEDLRSEARAAEFSNHRYLDRQPGAFGLADEPAAAF